MDTLAAMGRPGTADWIPVGRTGLLRSANMAPTTRCNPTASTPSGNVGSEMNAATAGWETFNSLRKGRKPCLKN